MRRHYSRNLAAIFIVLSVMWMAGCTARFTEKDLDGAWVLSSGGEVQTLIFSRGDDTYTAENFFLTNGRFDLQRDQSVRLSDKYGEQIILTPVRGDDGSWSLQHSSLYVTSVFVKAPAGERPLGAVTTGQPGAGMEAREVIGETVYDALAYGIWQIAGGGEIRISGDTIAIPDNPPQKFSILNAVSDGDGFRFSLSIGDTLCTGSLSHAPEDNDKEWPLGLVLTISFNDGLTYEATLSCGLEVPPG